MPEESFDLYQLRPEHEAVREVAREISRDRVAPNAAQADDTGEFPQASYDALRAADLHAPHLPTEYEGAGADALATAIIIEEISRACAASALIPAVNKLGTMPLLLAGSEELKRRFLPPVARGEAMFSYCLSEPEAGSDVAAMTTKAEPDGPGFVLSGVKRWITNAGVSRFYTVFAVTDPGAGAKGITAFVVDAETDQGVSFGAPERKLGIKGSPTREVYLDGVRVGPDRVVGAPGEGFKLAMRTLDHTRVTIAAQALGIADGALAAASEYVTQRRQFGQPVADFQAIQFMIADMGMKLAAARELTYAAAARSERADADLTFYGAAAKCFASDVAMEITTDAVQLLGGYGYSKEFPLERMMRDAKITQIYEGTNQIQRIVMARRLLNR